MQPYPHQATDSIDLSRDRSLPTDDEDCSECPTGSIVLQSLEVESSQFFKTKGFTPISKHGTITSQNLMFIHPTIQTIYITYA